MIGGNECCEHSIQLCYIYIYHKRAYKQLKVLLV